MGFAIYCYAMRYSLRERYICFANVGFISYRCDRREQYRFCSEKISRRAQRGISPFSLPGRSADGATQRYKSLMGFAIYCYAMRYSLRDRYICFANVGFISYRCDRGSNIAVVNQQYRAEQGEAYRHLFFITFQGSG